MTRHVARILVGLVIAAMLAPDAALAAGAQQPLTVGEIRTLQRQIAALRERNLAEQRHLAAMQTRLDRLVGALVATHPALRTALAPAPRAARRAAHVAAVLPVAPATQFALLRSNPAPVQLAQPVSVAPIQVAAQPAAPVARPTAAPTGRVPSESSIDTLYQNQNALFARGLTVTPSFTQVYSDSRFFTLNGFLALGAIFLGNINVSRQKSDVSVFNVGTTYGVTPRFQLSANLPYIYRAATYSTVGANGSGTQPSEVRQSFGDLADASVGVFYQAATETPKRPNIIVNAQVTLPTGKPPYGIKIVTDKLNSNLMYPQILTTGQGVVGLSGGASFIKTVDPVIFFGGANYYHNFPGRFNDISSDANQFVPGFAKPGEAVSYNVGTAFALNERSNLAFSFADTIQGETLLKPDGAKTYQHVVGSGSNAAVFNIGTTYVVNRRSSVQVQVGLGLTQDAPSFQINLRLPHKL